MPGNTGIENNLVTEEERPVLKRRVKRPLAKFAIGSFASLCAAFFFRLVILIIVSGQNIQLLDIFDLQYIFWALLFSLFVGIVVMLLEWHSVSKPGKFL